jgi:Carboxypeptidase regulatory-like domain/TonB dependent receptor-like, beta-barrel
MRVDRSTACRQPPAACYMTQYWRWDVTGGWTLRFMRVSAAVVAALYLGSGTALAQAGTAAISGNVADQQGGALPGATVTVTSPSTGAVRTTTTDSTGAYQVLALSPGAYDVKVELTGFRTALHERVTLSVDVQSRLDVVLQLGSLSETVNVTTEVSPINTTDASLGNVITGQQVRSLPLEANNVVGLLSLQPGAVYIPNAAVTDARTGAVLNIDPRNGAVSGGRADQSNVTLDGIDVNDPQTGAAYNSSVRVTLDSLQEFRVSTSNYGADGGRSSGAQVSLVTRSGTNDLHGSANWVQRDTRFSSNEYFLKLSQLQAGEESKAPKLDKKIYGGSLGGPLRKDRLFFFGNYERLTEDSETPALRNVPSMAMRDGVLIYPCADPAHCPGGSVRGFTDTHSVPAGHYGMSPADLASIDPLGIGPSQLASDYFKQFPTPNDPGIDGLNLVGYRFAAPIKNAFNTYIGRVDYRQSGGQSFFGRFNVQDDSVVSAPEYPGKPANTNRKTKSRGFAVGWDAVLSPTMVNTFRYGMTQIKEDIVGLAHSVQVDFRNIDPLEAQTASTGRDIPTHSFVDDVSWINGSHTFKFGGNVRFTRVGSSTNANSFHIPSANGSWVSGVGTTYMPGAPCPEPVTAACDALPAVDPGGTSTYGDTLIPLLGVISEVDAYYNYDRDGNVLPLGDAVRRRYATNEYELFGQDSWKIGENFTLTAGLRYSLFSPPWEVNGLQVAPDISLGDWLDERRALMLAGRSTSDAPLVHFDLAGPANDKPGYYKWDKNNFSPRFAAAWTPKSDHGLWGALTGNGKLAIRGGYSIVYDRVGTAIATNFDKAGAFGLSTTLSSQYGGHNEDDPSIRFAGLDVIPPTLPEAPPGGFPQTPPSYAGIITEALDGNLVTPYSHSFNVVVGRELGAGFSVEAAYVGRRGRNQLLRRDVAMPADLIDSKSGVDYFTAVGQLINASKQIPRDADLGAYSGIASIPFWENLFPDAAMDGLTATQRMAAEFNGHAPDYITALYNADEFCYPACSALGGFAFFAPQYDTLGVQSTIGRSQYDALQLSVRKRFSQGYQFDVNYTLGYAKDHASLLEGDEVFANYTNGGYTGFLMNSWDPDKQYGNSDYDVRHLVNVNWIADLPFGRSRKFASQLPGVLDAVIGGWSTAGVVRVTSGFPFTVINCRQCWPTNWDYQGNAELTTPGVLPPMGTTKDVIEGYPSPFKDPSTAVDYFRRAYPGEVGLRNVLRGDGYFSLDFSLSKTWELPWANTHKLRFRWDTFNLTNTPRFDIQFLDVYPDRASTFGRYYNTLATCDGGAGRCMQFALRYEF